MGRDQTGGSKTRCYLRQTFSRPFSRSFSRLFTRPKASAFSPARPGPFSPPVFLPAKKLQGLIDPLSKKVNHNLISTMINNKYLNRRRRGRNPQEEDKELEVAAATGRDQQQRPAARSTRTKKRQLPEEEQPTVSRARGGQKRLAMIDREQHILQRGPR